MKILLLDDQCHNIFAPILVSAGHTVDVALNSWDARSLYKTNGPYDLILTDVDHPGLNGIDLAAAIQRLNPVQHIGILTTYKIDRFRTLTKPFLAEDLLKFVGGFTSEERKM